MPTSHARTSLPRNTPFVRTAASYFKNIPDFPYIPNYLQYGDLRIAYIDEQSGTPRPDSEPQVFLCLHGQPTWSFLYRKMIPEFLHYTTNNTSPAPLRRVIVPDLLGFGRSDKPTSDAIYSFHFHRSALLHLIETLDLRNITLVAQDWGGILGLTIPPAMPTRFARLLLMNTMIATGDAPATPGFVAWRAFSNRNPEMRIGPMIGRGTPQLSEAERAAYDAPFPSAEYKAGVRRFPNMVMLREEGGATEGVDVSRQAEAFYASDGSPFGPNDVFMACGMKDPVLGSPVMQQLSRIWRNGCLYTEVADAGHFVQEWGEDVARLAIKCFESGQPVSGVIRVNPTGAKI